LSDGVRVLIRSRRAQRELAQHGQIGVGKLEQFDVGEDTEQRLVDRQTTGGKHRGQQAAAMPQPIAISTVLHVSGCWHRR
jgi:hypothetical protein